MKRYSGHGGYRDGSGRKAEWHLGAADAVIRVPKEIRDEVIRLAKELDRLRADQLSQQKKCN